MSAIFVSHASDDLPRVKLLVEALRAEKLSLWWDQEGLHGGDAFMEVIERELAASSCALVCWSRAALQKNRDWVRGEAEKARRRNIALSVLLDPVDLPVPFNVREAISLVDWRGDRSDERFQRLVADIRALVRASSPPPPPPERRSRRALLVGVSACASGFEPLPAAGGNVEELRRVLEQPACDFEVTALPEPDLQGMLDALDAFFGGAGPQDLLLFYYAGQVHLSGTQSLHLTARNSRRDGLKSTTLPFARLAEDYLDPCKADNLLFILDASYGDAARGPIEDALKTYLGHGRSKVLLASGAGPGASAGGWSESQSAFSSRLVRALDLDVSRADTNQDDVVTVGEITVYLHGELSAIHPDLRPIAQNFQAVPGEIVLRGRGSTPPPQLTAAQESFVARLAPELEQGALVPFLGDGIYSGGDLSFFSIAGALVKAAGLPGADKNEVGIATAAESLELQWQDRGRFLRALGDILRDQQSKCGPLPVHKLVADMPAPWGWSSP